MNPQYFSPLMLCDTGFSWSLGTAPVMLFVLVEKLNCLLNRLDILQASNLPLKFVSILLLKILQRRIWFMAR